MYAPIQIVGSVKLEAVVGYSNQEDNGAIGFEGCGLGKQFPGWALYMNEQSPQGVDVLYRVSVEAILEPGQATVAALEVQSRVAPRARLIASGFAPGATGYRVHARLVSMGVATEAEQRLVGCTFTVRASDTCAVHFRGQGVFDL